MLLNATPDGLQVIKHQATSIQHQVTKGDILKHICNDSQINFMQRWDLPHQGNSAISLFKCYRASETRGFPSLSHDILAFI